MNAVRRYGVALLLIFVLLNSFIMPNAAWCR